MKRFLYVTFTFAALLLFALPVTFLSAPSAYAEDSTATDEQPLQTGVVYLVVAPDLTWNDITDEKTPTLQSLAGHYACANVINHGQVDLTQYDGNEHFNYTRMNDASPSQVDEYVYSIYKSMKPGDSLLITSSPSLAKTPFTSSGYSMLIMVDNGDNGLLYSGDVRRSGLILSHNVGNALNALITAPQRNPGGLSTYLFSNYMGALQRTGQLAHDNSVAISIAESQNRFTFSFLIWLGVTFLVSSILLSLEIKLRPGFLEFLLPAARILWLITLAFPLATYILLLQLPSLTTAEVTYDFFLFVVMEITLIAVVIALMFRWFHALLFMLVGTAATMIIDILIGGPMTATGYLSYSPLDAVRYYGIGNEGASLLFSSWIMSCALLLNRAPHSSGKRFFRKYLFPIGSLLIITLVAAPWWGANFGVIIWGCVGSFVAWALFNKIPVTWKTVLGSVVISGLLALFVLFLDTTYNGDSHMGTQVNALNGDWYLQIFQILSDMVRLSWDTVTFSPVLSVCFLLILSFLIFLRAGKPGQYREFWDNNAYFKAGYTALLITSGLMLFIEDSGILMPSLTLLYPMAGMLWLVCDRHSWHIRRWLERKSHREFDSYNQEKHPEIE